jgi:hypothetical protein
MLTDTLACWNRGRGAMDLAFLHGGFRVARSAAKD